MLTPALIYAGIIVGVVIIHSIIVDILELNFSTYNSIAGSVLPLAGVVIAIYAFRKEYNNDIITYGKALKFGILVSLLIGLAASLFSFLYTHYINPELLEIGQQMAEEKLIKRGMSDEMIELALEQQKKFQKPVILIVFGTLITTFFGFIVSLIAASFLKKEPQDPFAGVE